MSFFGPKFAKTIDKALTAGSKSQGGDLTATLVVATKGTRTGGAVSAGTNPTTTSYPCRAFAESKAFFDQGSTTWRTVETVTVLGASLPSGVAPKVGDSVVIGGKSRFLSAVTDRSSGAVFEFVAS